MAYQVLARKYRPQRFADVAGQDHVTRTLMNALSQNRIAHGYIFSGHRGIGKTTIARIVAMALNCQRAIGSDERPSPEPCGVCDSCVEIRQGNAVDVIEIDAATNRGIDEIRELRDAARYAPARDRYKIYILDEAHQITEAAFNALLKTLEEPPAHVVFMMATTEPENIPQTIRSRCQHFSFHAVRFDDILAQLKTIAAEEKLTAEDDALALLAEAGDGSMRDALSIMDQAIASAPVEEGRPALSAAQIRELMGAVPNAVFERLLEAVAAGQSAELMKELNQLLNAGHSPLSLARQMVRYLRNAVMAKLGGAETELMQISSDERARAARTSLLFTEEELTRNLQIVLRTFDDLNYRQEQRFHLELGLLKLIHAQRLLPIEELLSGALTGAGVRTSTAPSASKSNVSALRTASQASPAPAAPPLSPFGTVVGMDSRSGSRQSSSAEVIAGQDYRNDASRTALAEGIAVAQSSPGKPIPASSAVTSSSGTAAALTEGALAMAPDTQPAEHGSVNVETLRRTVCTALHGGNHTSAAEVLQAGRWSLDGSSLRIEVGLGKKMIGLTVNPAAEKIIRQELQRLGAPTRFLVLPGETTATGARASTAVGGAQAGSVEEAAYSHPLVEQARELFKAEVRSVIDLRTK